MPADTKRTLVIKEVQQMWARVNATDALDEGKPMSLKGLRALVDYGFPILTKYPDAKVQATPEEYQALCATHGTKETLFDVPIVIKEPYDN